MANVFYAQKDALGFPIPGTMMSVPATFNDGDGPKAAGVQIDSNLYDDLTEPVGRKLHPEGLRYFVRKDKKGNIIPNSLIISFEKPAGLVYEFKKA